ncbi:MAG: protein adenylyltransferase Fic [Hyphomicrobium sp.]
MPPDPKVPFNELPHLPPQIEIETKAVLKRCVLARAAIAELRRAGELIPDQSVLVNTIPLLEAKDSSEIENIVTTNDALFSEASQIDDGNDPAAKEALRYRSALFNGSESLKTRPLTARTATDICSQIKGVELDVRKTPGTQLKNSLTGDVIYTPPEGEQTLRDLLSNWEKFANADDDLDPLVRMAVLHYQFEAIHPFIDGNGRTGRILNVLVLMQAGLLDIPTLYLSRYIVRTKSEYYRLLQNVTLHGDWEPWIIYMLIAVETTASWTNARIRAIRDLMTDTSNYVEAAAPGLHSHQLIQAIFALPYTRIGHLVERGVAQRVSASRYLKQLVELGVLVEEKRGRDKVFIHRKYMALLGRDDHAFEAYAAPDSDAQTDASSAPGRKTKNKRRADG